ncbi:hypothetical protein BCR39DRAFT_463616 [Naematelia encephala]|uniref:DUF7137 domain-containing protein n=1 Tax=Naematelia encephala TaxID=71784 RepID=A0A1Y2BET5_9TREE|nr:hypothetical protein BCR39DRAFT_463616 [Naematelia encephala]
MSSSSASRSSSSGSVNANASSTTSSISIPGTAAAGGLTVTQPPSTASASYFKIAEHEFITFGWNLTSLYVTPQHLTIIASCSANGNTYPVGPTASPSNTIPANQTQIIWNPHEWEQIPGQTPFAEATYVLKIWDERGPGVGVKGGFFSPYAGTDFMMYRPEQYTSIADGWKCTTCSNAFNHLSEPTGLALVTSFLIMLFSAWNILSR